MPTGTLAFTTASADGRELEQREGGRWRAERERERETPPSGGV